MHAPPEIIESKKNILLNLKKKYYKLNKQVMKYYFENNKNNGNNENIVINHSNLYYKVIKIMNNLSKYIKYEFSNSKKIIKEEKEQELIIINLSKLELMIEFFMNEIDLFKRNNPKREKNNKNKRTEKNE